MALRKLLWNLKISPNGGDKKSCSKCGSSEMNNTYDLYGSKNVSLLLARSHIEQVLGILFEERNSTYQGGNYYIFGSRDSENFILKTNLDPFDEKPVEQSFPDCSVLLYINATDRSADIEKTLKKSDCFKLLRHEVL